MTDGSIDRAAEDAFDAEALPHLDAVYRFALRLSGSSDRAEDLVQETFLRAYRARHQFTPGTAAKSWLFTICRNVFLRTLERHKRHEEIVEQQVERSLASIQGAGSVWSSVEDVDPEGVFFDSIVDERILQAIAELPEEFRTVFVLSDVEDLSYSEVAELMEVPVGTVKSRLFRGRRLLQKTLFEYAVEMRYVDRRRTPREE